VSTALGLDTVVNVFEKRRGDAIPRVAAGAAVASRGPRSPLHVDVSDESGCLSQAIVLSAVGIAIVVGLVVVIDFARRAKRRDATL